MAYIDGVVIPNNSIFGYSLTDNFKNESCYRRWGSKKPGDIGRVDSHGRYHRPEILGGPPHGLLWDELERRGIGSQNITIDHRKGRDVMVWPGKYNCKTFIHGNLVGKTSTKRLRRAEFRSVKDILTRAAKKGKLDEMVSSMLEDFPIFKDIIEKLSNKPSILRLNRKALANAANKNGFIALLAGLFR